MKQLQKQIEITKKQKQELETVNSAIAKIITTMQTNISLIKEENNTTIAFEISNYAKVINQLPKDFQPTFLQILIQIVSFGAKNYKKAYMSHLETLNSEREKLIEKLSSNEQYIKEIQNKIGEKELEFKSNSEKIEQLNKDITKLENEFDIKLELFKNKLTSFQIKILHLAKNCSHAST